MRRSLALGAAIPTKSGLSRARKSRSICMKKSGLSVLLLIALARFQDTSRTVQPVAQPTLGVATVHETAGGTPSQYIVVFNNNVTNADALARQLAAEHGASVQFTYEVALKGFAARMSDAAATALARNPNVDYVEQ